MQESRLLSNYPWLWGRNGTRARVAYWGHGRNFQSSSPHGLRERWKKSLVGRVDWWFAYTQMTRDILLRDGYPETRITVLDNAIDNQAFKQDLDSVSAHEVAALKKQYGIADSAKIGLFCGSLYPDKRLGLLVEAADKIQSIMPTFQLAIIGEGPSAAELELAAATRRWIIRLGVKNGREKARWFKAADVILNPGLVGLHVLDAFCSGKPMISTLDAKHSPEIAYLENGCNGVLTAGTPDDYARAVLDLLADDAAYAALAEAGLVASNRYTLDNMVKNFVSGVADCLAVSS
jgi:glycosyltransferase involved in cell wall biosynthesis